MGHVGVGGGHLAPAPAKGHCDKPGCGPDSECCGREDWGECNNDGHLDTAPTAPKPVKPAAAASTGTAAKKRVVAETIIAAAEIVGNWQHDEISTDEARSWISAWMNYLPSNVWDERLGQRSGAGRRNAS